MTSILKSSSGRPIGSSTQLGSTGELRGDGTMTAHSRSQELIAGLDDARFRRIDGSLRSLVHQLVQAAVGFLVATIVAWKVADEWLGLADDARGVVLRALLVSTMAGLMLYVTSGRPIRKALLEQRALVASATKALHLDADRHRFRAELDEGLRMCEDENAIVGLIGQALDRVDATGTMEVLLADASNAHLRVAAESSQGGPGCRVSTPQDCPAVRRGHTRKFETSTALDACPELRGRLGGDTAATCVPLTVLGSPVGVVHRVDPDGSLAPELVIDELETVADLVGSRLSVVRAMATTERQASTDVLTGVLNRRSLGDRIRDLHRKDEPFAIAFVDLDHFKDLNDTFGHEAGDQALRLFSRVVSDTIRDRDAVGRWGGEEFVVLFTGADRAIATKACERIRSGLRDEIQASNVPPFTASFGIADHTQARTIDRLLALADRAMFVAKTNGRDRIVAVDDSLDLEDGLRDFSAEPGFDREAATDVAAVPESQ